MPDDRQFATNQVGRVGLLDRGCEHLHAHAARRCPMREIAIIAVDVAKRRGLENQERRPWLDFRRFAKFAGCFQRIGAVLGAFGEVRRRLTNYIAPIVPHSRTPPAVAPIAPPKCGEAVLGGPLAKGEAGLLVDQFFLNILDTAFQRIEVGLVSAGSVRGLRFFAGREHRSAGECKQRGK